MKQATSNSKKEKMKAKPRVSRREALKLLAAAAGGVSLSSLPNQWEKPVIELGVLPAHAQISAALTATPTPIPPLGNEFAVMSTCGDGNQIIVFPRRTQTCPILPKTLFLVCPQGPVLTG